MKAIEGFNGRFFSEAIASLVEKARAKAERETGKNFKLPSREEVVKAIHAAGGVVTRSGGYDFKGKSSGSRVSALSIHWNIFLKDGLIELQPRFWGIPWGLEKEFPLPEGIVPVKVPLPEPAVYLSVPGWVGFKDYADVGQEGYVCLRSEADALLRQYIRNTLPDLLNEVQE